MKTLSHIIAWAAILIPVMASANTYESRVKEALGTITQKASNTSLGLTYSAHSDPETGQNDGELRIVKFKLGPREAYLVEQAKAIYELINNESQSGKIPYLYTLWLNTANQDRTYSGINLYYSHENSILVGAEADNCYTVGFFLSENTDYRNTYTLEWSATSGDSVKGRVITTFGPVASKVHTLKFNSDNWPLDYFDFGFDTIAFNAQMERLQVGMARFNEGMERMNTSPGTIVITSTTGERSSSNWMKKMLFYLEKIQQSGDRYLYLSKLYELCKDTKGLDQTDLRIALQQMASVYKQLKTKNKLKENELLFLESMVDLLESKIQ